MSTMRPKHWPAYVDVPVYCPMRSGECLRFDCVMGDGSFCEKRNALTLVPKDEPEPHSTYSPEKP